MNDIDDEIDSCEGDRYDQEEDCPKCNGTGKIPLFTSISDCVVCEGTGVNLEKAGYYDQPQTD